MPRSPKEVQISVSSAPIAKRALFLEKETLLFEDAKRVRANLLIRVSSVRGRKSSNDEHIWI